MAGNFFRPYVAGDYVAPVDVAPVILDWASLLHLLYLAQTVPPQILEVVDILLALFASSFLFVLQPVLQYVDPRESVHVSLPRPFPLT